MSDRYRNEYEGQLLRSMRQGKNPDLLVVAIPWAGLHAARARLEARQPAVPASRAGSVRSGISERPPPWLFGRGALLPGISGNLTAHRLNGDRL